MATTAGGLPYVESSDLISGYPTVSQALAEELDDQLAAKVTGSAASTAPGSPVVGQMFIDTDDNSITIWNGSAWVNPSNAGLSAATVGGTTGSPGTSSVGSKTLYSWTANGSITFSAAGWVRALVVSGGVGAGSGGQSGGGGYVTDGYLYVAAQTYACTIGAGGSYPAGNGGLSYFYLQNYNSVRHYQANAYYYGIGGYASDARGLYSDISGSSVGYGGGGQSGVGGYDSAFGGAPTGGSPRANSGGGGVYSGPGAGAAGIVQILV